MSRLPFISGRKAIRVLEQLGFKQIRQQDSHVVFKRENGKTVSGCVVPLHKELALGTLRGILRQAKVTPEEFVKVLRKGI
jgi:predicted RNA binding protein YcfA (HicA-like mRNA interferase family)